VRVLVIGSGGREHALVWKIRQSPRVTRVFCAPGNAGLARDATCVPIGADAINDLCAFAERERIDLTVVGPEAPLVAGIVDTFRARGLRVFGPSKAASRLEGSKAWCHAFMERHRIPCAGYRLVHTLDAARAAVHDMGIPIVIKASGLAAGKGAIVCHTAAEVEVALRRMFVDREFGAASDEVVIEEFMDGEEASCLALADGKVFVALPSSQDHKRVFDGDKGPNTGGMGAYAPAPVLDACMQTRVNAEILKPMIDGLAAEGTPYAGILYAGLMITKAGPRIIEFNCRFGDPETQCVLPLLVSDLLEHMLAVTDGTLRAQDVRVSPGAAVCIVAASGGYPDAYAKGARIEGLADVPPDVWVFHAGTAERDGTVVTAGGRVLGVTAAGPDIRTAVDRAYAGIAKIRFEKMHYRHDIAARALHRG
jgi:phosphoribosylamine--glycine ligase